MRISELSRRTGLPIPTIKFYLRDGLLPPGELTSATQASYDEAHIERLRLIRALTDSADLPLSAVRRVLDLIDDPPQDVQRVFGEVQRLLEPDEVAEVGPASALLEHWGWDAKLCKPDGPLQALAAALDAADRAGFEIPDGALDRYAEAMHAVAEVEIAHTPTGSLSEAVRYTVLGSVLMEPVLLAIRRLAEADVSLRRAAQHR